MKVLSPTWTSAKADEERLNTLHDQVVDLLLQGVHADTSAAQMQLLTSKMAAKDLATLKKSMLRPGFVQEWNSLDAMAASFAKVLLAKENAVPSASYKLFTSYDPEAVLWLGFTSQDKAVRERYNLFLKTWPEVRQRIPHAIILEMRITPELATYKEILHNLFLELIDGRLTAPEEVKAFLEPYSPPAPPPKEVIKRTRAKRGAEAKVKERSYDDEDEDDMGDDDDEDLDDLGADDEEEEEIDLKIGLSDVALESDLDGDLDDDDDLDEPAPAKPVAKAVKAPKAPKAEKAEVEKPLKAAKAAKAAPAKLEKAAKAPAAKAAKK